MLKKVIKYDFKAMLKELLPLYLIITILSIVYRVFDVIGTHVKIIQYITTTMLFLFVITCIGIFIYTFIVSIKRFYNNLLKEEGYLTHTLPVEKWKLIISKLIVSLLFFLFTTMVVTIAILVAFYQKGMIDMIINFIQPISESLTVSIPTILAGIILFLSVGYMNSLMMVYFGLTLGFAQNTGKLGYSVLFTIVAYMISQILTSILLVLLIVINPDIFNYLNTAVPPTNFLYQILGVSLIGSLSVFIIYYVVINIVMNKKLNLE